MQHRGKTGGEIELLTAPSRDRTASAAGDKLDPNSIDRNMLQIGPHSNSIKILNLKFQATKKIAEKTLEKRSHSSAMAGP